MFLPRLPSNRSSPLSKGAISHMVSEESKDTVWFSPARHTHTHSCGAPTPITHQRRHLCRLPRVTSSPPSSSAATLTLYPSPS